MASNTNSWFTSARFGLFIHYGLFSLLERGEWTINREGIPVEEYKRLMNRFTAAKFDADQLCDLAVRCGMRYVVFTTMHHDAFRMYDSALSDFTSVKSPAKRDLTAEMIAAARKRGLKIGLYHSLNDWTDRPDAVDALEDESKYETFIRNTFDRIRELNEKYKPFDTMWYDGWWPFSAERWRSSAMNAMVREIQPNILFNGRNGLPGDFATPEQHLSAPSPWRPWEACITLNDSWGYHHGDHNWKTPGQVIDMLATVAQGKGNLLLNVGPRGDGSIPPETLSCLNAVADWMQKHRESVFDTEQFTYGLRERKPEHRGDWCHHGPFTIRGNNLYLLVRRWPGSELAINGIECQVKNVTLVGSGQTLKFKQSGQRVVVQGLPETDPDPVCSVLRFECDRAPSMYLSGGLRKPKADHPPYDPCQSDIAHD